jgi:hypothetical protein
MQYRREFEIWEDNPFVFKERIVVDLSDVRDNDVLIEYWSF